MCHSKYHVPGLNVFTAVNQNREDFDRISILANNKDTSSTRPKAATTKITIIENDHCC